MKKAGRPKKQRSDQADGTTLEPIETPVNTNNGNLPVEPTIDIKICCEYSELIPIADIKPNPKNNNRHPEEQYKRLAKNMLNLGIRHPVTISKLSGLVVFGHARLEAFKLLGMTKVPVEYQEFKDEQEEYAAMTADNALQSEWAELDLSSINLEIPNFDPNFDLDLLGLKDFKVDASELDIKDVELGEKKKEPTICPRCGHEF